MPTTREGCIVELEFCNTFKEWLIQNYGLSIALVLAFILGYFKK